MLLCDAAQVADGKLYILGGGWSMTDRTLSLAVRSRSTWTGMSRDPHHWELFLEDADGQPSCRDAHGRSRSRCEDFTVAHPPGIPEARRSTWRSPSTWAHPARAGTRFAWRLTIDGESLANASLGFTTRPRPTDA